MNYEFAISHDTLIIKSNLKGNVTFSIPLGEGDVKKALDSIKEYCLFHNIPMNFHGVTEPAAKILTDHFGDIFEIRNLENWGEYIYRYSIYCTLKAKIPQQKKSYKPICKELS